MNVCLVSQQYPPETLRGGIGVQTWNKARSLARLGHAVHVVTSAGVRAMGQSAQEDVEGVTVHRVQPPGVEFPVDEEPAYWIGYSWAVARELHRLMGSVRLDVVDFPDYGAEGFAYQLNRTRSNWVPVVVQLHAPLAMFAEHMAWPEKGSDFYRVGALMEEISIRRADALMACSSNIADFTADFCGVRRESIEVVHCGVDTEEFQPSLARGGDGDRRPTVLFVGNIARNKGVQTVVEAVLGLRRKYPDLRLRVVGSGDRHLTQSMKARAQAEGGLSAVEFSGFVGRTALPKLYQEADVFCSPAVYEGGVANVYIEAMACACPVVASTAGGAPEAVVDGDTGLLVPPDDVDATAKALDRLLGDGALRQRLGAAGRRRVEEQFALDQYILRVLAVYRKAIDGSAHAVAGACSAGPQPSA